VIKISNVSYKYNKGLVLDDINLEFPKGSWISIIGANGSGKSTLAKLIVGLLKPRTGSITIDEEKVEEDNLVNIRKKIGIIFQNPDNQFVGVTVRHDLAFSLENANTPWEEMVNLVDKTIKEFSLEDLQDKEPDNLSGGQKQRVAIAGALISDLDYIIFDESTSMLDPQGVLEILSEMKKLSQAGKTIIHITHDLDLACKGDDILILVAGKVFKYGSVKQILADKNNILLANLELSTILDIYYNLALDSKYREVLWEYLFKK
jgi:energy-coupling factor transport system ATP-binding protein